MKGGQSFDQALQTANPPLLISQSFSQPENKPPEVAPFPLPTALSSKSNSAVTKSGARAAYGKQIAAKPAAPPGMSGWEKYKEDQLLRNPGARYYSPDQGKIAAKGGKKPLAWLIGRDISGVVGNIRNFFANIFKGGTISYRDEKNQLRQGRQTGLLKTVGNFFRDFAAALSFGAYHPGSQKAVQGFKNRLSYSASKLKEAFLGDLIDGIPSSVNHMAQNAILSGWRLAEVIPDAVLGSFQAGRKLTTTIFDNGQVAVEYLTDIAPSGDAWLRVHASDLQKLMPPVYYNLKMPEHLNTDMRWKYVRNTPFRKTIETIGSLLADGLLLGFSGQTGGSSERRSGE